MFLNIDFKSPENSQNNYFSLFIFTADSLSIVLAAAAAAGVPTNSLLNDSVVSPNIQPNHNISLTIFKSNCVTL